MASSTVSVSRVGVQLKAYQAARFEPQRRGRKLNGIFKIAALRLEVVGPQVHALRPHDAREKFHKSLL